MNYATAENVLKINEKVIDIIEHELNKGYGVKMTYDKRANSVYILFKSRKKPENWPDNIKLTDAQTRSLETILNGGQSAKIDLASVITVSLGEEDVKSHFS